jgi:hypothetical protein
MSAYTAAPVDEAAAVDEKPMATPATAVPPPPRVESRKPTGSTPWPSILIEGGEKSGKSHEAAKFTGDERFSQAFWLELGSEGTAEWYGLVPNARYELLLHNGTFTSIRQRIAEVHAYAQWTVDTGQAPIMLVIDTIGALWRMIQAWVDWKARQSKEARRKLASDPSAEIQASIATRNQGKAMWDEFLLSINRIPAVKLLLSRGQEVTKFEAGQPTTEKSWSVVGHKELGFEMDVWARLQRGSDVELIGVRHPVKGIQANDQADRECVRRRDFSLAWLVFERYGLDLSNVAVRSMHDVNDPSSIESGAVAIADPEEAARRDRETRAAAAELVSKALAAATREEFMPHWTECSANSWWDVELPDGTVRELLEAQAERIKQLEKARAAQAASEKSQEPAVATKPEHGAAVIDVQGCTEDQRAGIKAAFEKIKTPFEARERTVKAIVGRNVRGLSQLTYEEAAAVAATLAEFVDMGDDAMGALARRVAEFAAGRAPAAV